MYCMQVTKTTAYVINRRAASMSLTEAIKGPAPTISLNEASNLDKVVLWLKDPMRRVDSWFDFISEMELDSTDYKQFPKGIIHADGPRIDQLKGLNDQNFTSEKKALHDERVSILRRGRIISDENLAQEAVQVEYEKYIDWLIENESLHTSCQYELATDPETGLFVPNIAHLTDTPQLIEAHWWKYLAVGQMPVRTHRSRPIPHEPYRVVDLESKLSKSINLHTQVKESPDGVWTSR